MREIGRRRALYEKLGVLLWIELLGLTRRDAVKILQHGISEGCRTVNSVSEVLYEGQELLLLLLATFTRASPPLWKDSGPHLPQVIDTPKYVPTVVYWSANFTGVITSCGLEGYITRKITREMNSR
jgi:hypothetical protein